MLKFFKTATVVKTHGYKGDIVLKKEKSISSNLFDECLKEGNAIFVSKNGIPVPFFIAENSLYFLDNDTVRLRFDNINSVEKAQEFISDEVFFTENCLENKNPENTTLLLIGCTVSDLNSGYLGIVKDFNEDVPENPLLIVDKNGQDLLIPFNGNFIIEIFLENKEIVTRLPEGFIDLYQ